MVLASQEQWVKLDLTKCKAYMKTYNLYSCVCFINCDKIGINLLYCTENGIDDGSPYLVVQHYYSN